LGTFPSTDELALGLDDSLHAFLAEVHSERLQSTLGEIESVLHAMTGDPNTRWRVEELESDSRWRVIRRLAREALDQMS
jgi:hypothetical protein